MLFCGNSASKIARIEVHAQGRFIAETALWLGKDTEADEIIVGVKGVQKVRTVRRHSPSQQWNPALCFIACIAMVAKSNG